MSWECTDVSCNGWYSSSVRPQELERNCIVKCGSAESLSCRTLLLTVLCGYLQQWPRICLVFSTYFPIFPVAFGSIAYLAGFGKVACLRCYFHGFPCLSTYLLVTFITTVTCVPSQPKFYLCLVEFLSSVNCFLSRISVHHIHKSLKGTIKGTS